MLLLLQRPSRRGGETLLCKPVWVYVIVCIWGGFYTLLVLKRFLGDSIFSGIGQILDTLFTCVGWMLRSSMHWGTSYWEDKPLDTQWNWPKCSSLILHNTFCHSGSGIKPNTMQDKGIHSRSECWYLTGLDMSVCVCIFKGGSKDFTGKNNFLTIKHGKVRGLRKWSLPFRQGK